VSSRKPALLVLRRVGLQIVRLLYGLYVFGHLSKWFAFLFLVPVSLSGCVVRYTRHQHENSGNKITPFKKFPLITNHFALYIFGLPLGQFTRL
jgi:hypothetical protein